MRLSLPDSLLMPWRESPRPPKIATLLAVAGILSIFLSTLFGVSALSDWLLVAAQALLLLGFIVFTVYILIGIVRAARSS